jgi:maleamate amidohydrolase
MDGHAVRGYGNGRIGLGRRAALLLIDFQYLLTNSESPMYGGKSAEAALFHTERLVRTARELGLKIIYTTVGYRKDGQDMGFWPLKVRHLSICTEGSRWTRIPDEIRPADSDVVIKKRMASAFFGTDLITLLNLERIDTVIVCGGTTGGCVRATVVDAFQNGIRVVVPRECTFDMDEEAHRVNLNDINKRYGDVLYSEELVQEIRDAYGDDVRAGGGVKEVCNLSEEK